MGKEKSEITMEKEMSWRHRNYNRFKSRVRNGRVEITGIRRFL